MSVLMEFYVLQIHTLLALPEDLADMSPQSTDLFVSHLSPCDLDWSWSHAASHTSYDWLENVPKTDRNSFMAGRVCNNFLKLYTHNIIASCNSF